MEIQAIIVQSAEVTYRLAAQHAQTRLNEWNATKDHGSQDIAARRYQEAEVVRNFAHAAWLTAAGNVEMATILVQRTA